MNINQLIHQLQQLVSDDAATGELEAVIYDTTGDYEESEEVTAILDLLIVTRRDKYFLLIN